jgi:hypothetical protein
VFCEWGSGFGVCTCLAAKLGYESFGLEINPNLAAYSRELAQDLSLNVQILETSYVPEDYESYSGIGGEFLIKNEKVASRDARVVSELTYEGMDHEIAEIDVFFAYPWPMEQEFMQELFDEIAVEGAILICYHRDSEICAYRKLGGNFWSSSLVTPKSYHYNALDHKEDSALQGLSRCLEHLDACYYRQIL